MKRRIVKKWEKRGISDEMMKKHLARKGRLNSNNNSKKRSNWTPNYRHEEVLVRMYSRLQSVSPQNPALQYGVLDDEGHFEITPRFYEEQFPGEEDRSLSRAILRYLTVLKREYEQAIGYHPPKLEDILGQLEQLNQKYSDL